MTDLDDFADGDAVIQSAAKLITEQRHHQRTRRVVTPERGIVQQMPVYAD